jgi:ppGpp synthetase/RelA/SpoT-type nucleotidyltranferase
MDFVEYERAGFNAYKEFAETVATLLRNAIIAEAKYRLQEVRSRAKEPDSLRKKLYDRGLEASNAIENEIKDLSGCRVIFYTNTDVSRLLSSGLIYQTFDVVDYKVHHPEHAVEDSELYTSNHFVVKHTADMLAQPGFGQFVGMRCEIQVQTILNHAWSEMAHDTVYKAPKLGALGKRTLDEIKARMRRIAQEYLVPAGHEFQKVAADYDRLIEGKALADERPLNAIVAAPDNNVRFDALVRFKDLVLPLYDNLTESYPIVVDRLIAAAQAARAMAPVAVETPYGNYAGKSFEQVLIPVGEILSYYRYVDPAKTLAAALALDDLAEEPDAAKGVIKLVEGLTKFNFHLADHGLGVQATLLDAIDHLGPEGWDAHRRLLTPMLGNMLSLEVSGTTHHSAKVEFKRGTLPESPELKAIRARAVHLLKAIFVRADTDAQRLAALQAIRTATRAPMQGGYSEATHELIMRSAAEVIEFHTQILPGLSLELRQACEAWANRLYRTYMQLPDNMRAQPRFVDTQAPLIAAGLGFRDAVNADPEYVIFKILVGYESIFPPAWVHKNFDYTDAKDYRQALFPGLVDSVTDATAEAWLRRLDLFARADGTDAATFPSFSKFLGQLAEAKPEIVLGYLPRLDGPLKTFLPRMLNGLLKSVLRPQTVAMMDQWIATGQNLALLAWQQRVADPFDEGLLSRILQRAMAINDLATVTNVLIASAEQFDAHAGTLISEVFMPAIVFLEASGQYDWLRWRWTSWYGKGIVEGLDGASAERLLRALVRCPELEHNCEYMVASVAKNFPVKVLCFIGERIKLGKSDAAPADYEAVPFDPHMLSETLQAQLAKSPEVVLEEAQAWFRTDRLRFPYEGARTVVSIFPAVEGEMTTYLMQIATEGDRGELAFLVALMEAYNGQQFLYPILRALVARLKPDDALLKVVARVFEKSGVVHGEFGYAELNVERRGWIQPWLEDENDKVRVYGQKRIRELDATIASETRRAEIDIAMRRLRYGEDVCGDGE